MCDLFLFWESRSEKEREICNECFCVHFNAIQKRMEMNVANETLMDGTDRNKNELELMESIKYM